MALVRVSVDQIRAAYELYTAVRQLILCEPIIGCVLSAEEDSMYSEVVLKAWNNMLAAVARYKEEYETDG